MGWTRRDFITRVGQAGGYSAAFLAMQGMGWMAPAAAKAEVAAEPGSGAGVKVVVLGGGIAGLVTAYELRKLGYGVTLLEARSRPGGRNWTVRGGDTVDLLDGSTQECRWDRESYQNFGPARLPSIHHHILGYCRELGVELQVEVNMTSSALLQNDHAMGGKPVVMRQAVNDTRGHVSALLSKVVNQGSLDAELTGEDRERMLAFLRLYGELDEAGKYTGCDRAGYSRMAGAGDVTGVLSQPIAMQTLLEADFWQGMLFAEMFDMQATMFQPVGGMDRIPYAFAKSLGEIVVFDAPVTEIRKTAQGVRVGYTKGGGAQTIEADYCVCALPLTILRKIPNDLSAPYKKVIEECTYAGAYKIAWESRRFWEQDYNVYGGLEFCNVGCSPIWFPSGGLFTQRGVMVSGYTDETEIPFGKLTLAEKLGESRRSVERLHPGHGKELEKPMYVGWSKVKWNEGSWIRSYGPGQYEGDEAAYQQSHRTGGIKHPAKVRTETNPGYETLIQPDGRIVLAGDHVTHVVAWQEGAALSGLRAVQLVSDQVKAARLSGGGGATLA